MSNEINPYSHTTINVVKKQSPARTIGKITCYTLGGIGMILAVIQIFTIIGIISGIVTGLVAGILILVGIGMQDEACPNCSSKITIFHIGNRMKCPHCKIPISINWSE